MDIAQAVGLVNQSVRDLAAYHLKPIPASIKLNQNENPYDWPSDIKEEMAAFCRERPWNRYPPFIPDELKAALGAHVGVGADSIIAGNGSNEVLLTLLISLMDRSLPVILCQPTFTVYELLVRALGGTTETVFLREPDLTFDMDALCAASRANPRSLVILCSPNNPTGSWLEEGDLRRFLEVHEGIVVLDQAYIEFGGYNGLALQKEFPNLLITRTFSKALGGAGLRLGYLVGAPELVVEINKAKLPYNLNFFSEHIARVLLRNSDRMDTELKELRAARDSMYQALCDMPFERVWPSAANFMMARTAHRSALFEYLAAHDILIRDVSSYPMLNDCIRVNVGTPDENRALLDTMKAFFDTVTT